MEKKVTNKDDFDKAFKARFPGVALHYKENTGGWDSEFQLGPYHKKL